MNETKTTEKLPEIISIDAPGTARSSDVPAMRPEVMAPLYGNDPFLAMIERAAYAPSFNPEAMRFLLAERQKIIDDQRRMLFNEAFSKAQLRFRPAKKNRVIDARKDKDDKKGQYTPYADWMAQWDAVQTPLNENGLSLWHEIKAAPGAPITIIAHLEHSGGWHRETQVTFPHDPSGSKNAVQGEVSAITYGRRITGMAILNLTAEDDPGDDDGAATGGPTNEQVILVSEKQVAELRTALEGASIKEKAVLGAYNITALEELPAERLGDIYDRIAKKVAATPVL